MPGEKLRFVCSTTCVVAALTVWHLASFSVACSQDQSAASNAEASRDPLNTLIFAQDRLVEQSIDAVSKFIESGEYAAASNVLRQLNADMKNSFAPEGRSSTVVSSQLRIFAQQQKLPAEIRARLIEEADLNSRLVWDRLKREGSIEELAAFVDHNRLGPAGFEALQYLAGQYRDSGRQTLASVAYEQIASDFRATPTQRAYALMARIDCLLRSGRFAEAHESADELLTLTRDMTVVVAGQRQEVADWWAEMQRRFHPEASAAPSGNTMERLLPGLTSAWSRDVGAVSEIEKILPGIQRYFREQGVVSSPLLRPLVAGNIVVTRTMEEICAFDLKSGEQLWTLPNQEYSWISKRPGMLESVSLRPTIANDWHRRVEADSLFSSMSTDAKLLLVIQEQDRSSVDYPGPTRTAGLPDKASAPVVGPRWNRLFGYEVASRELRWQIGGQRTGPEDVYGGIAFLGAPLFVDDVLMALGQRDDEIVLLAIDQMTGHLRWSLGLGVLPPHLVEVTSRRRMACTVNLVDGLLLCPTTSGSLVAVDPISRSIAWAYRYHTIQHDQAIRPTAGPAPAALPDYWWNEWRDVNCVARAAGDAARTRNDQGMRSKIAVLATPESDALHAVDSRSGALMWTVPRSGALHLAGLTEKLAIVIEPMAARAHDLTTGRVEWRLETGEISGRGTVVGNHLIQPRRSGGFVVIDLQRGEFATTLSDEQRVFGTLVPCPGGWITQTDQTLMRLPFLDDVRVAAEKQWRERPDEASTVALARVDLQTGDASSARKHLEALDKNVAGDLRRSVIVSLLRRHAGTDAHQKADLDSLSQELLDLCRSDEERLPVLRTLGEVYWGARDVMAVSHYLNALDLIDSIGLRSIGDWTGNDVSSRAVRPDRVVLGALEQILRDAHADGGSLLDTVEQLLLQRLARAKSSRDPFAAQLFLDRMMALEWGHRLLLTHLNDASYGRPPSKVEPLLLTAMGSRDRTTAATAAFQLSELLNRSGWRNEMEAFERRLLMQYPGIPACDGLTIATLMATDGKRAESLRSLQERRLDPWPDVVPEVERLPKRNQGVYQFPIRIQATPGTLLDRLDASIDRQGLLVRFMGAGHSEPWEVGLPKSPRQLRSAFANLDQLEAYGVGRILVMRVGSEIFGILPVNDHGEPNKKGVLYQIEMIHHGDVPSDSQWWPETVPGKAGIRHAGIRVIDGFGHSLGGLGPVRPNYFCYRSQARLVALDTQSGRRLWERMDLPPKSHIFGDENRVYINRTGERTLQILSAVDGRVLEERPWSVSPDDMLMQQGSRCWVTSRSTGGLQLIDARDGAVEWARTFSPNSLPFALDHDTLAVIEPRGLLHLLSADSGATLGDPSTIDAPKNIERVICLHDADRWYVAVSAPVPRVSMLQSEQIWSGLNMAFVNGWLYGIDKQTATISWRRWLSDEPLHLQASRNVPVLVQMWKKSSGDPGSGQTSAGTLKLLDKRTGKEVLSFQDPQLQSYFVLNWNENREMLQFQTERDMFRLDYKKQSDEANEERASSKN